MLLKKKKISNINILTIANTDCLNISGGKITNLVFLVSNNQIILSIIYFTVL